MSKRQTRKNEKKVARKARKEIKRARTEALAMPTEIPGEITDKFFWLRGRAIQEYALLEQSQCLLLATLTKTSNERAGIIFFKVTNKDAVVSILNLLLKQLHEVGECCGNANEPCMFRKPSKKSEGGFWGSFTDLLRAHDKERNEVVHWIADINHNCEFFLDQPREWVLMPANVHGWHEKIMPYNATRIVGFIDKCRFLRDLCDRFRMTLNLSSSEWNDAKHKTWLDIFQQPVVYPPPPNHPLCRSARGDDIQPPPSQE